MTNGDRIIKCYLSGGGDDIFALLASQKEIFANQTIGYVAVAAEINQELIQLVRHGFAELTAYLKSLGAKDATLVDSTNLEEAFKADLIVLSGGDSGHLIRVLGERAFETLLRVSKVQVLVGISAGAIAVAKEGIGKNAGKEVVYSGLGLVDATVVPHSTEDMRMRYPNATHLAEYEWQELSVVLKKAAA